MMRLLTTCILLTSTLALGSATAQDRTVGLFVNHEQAYEGYTLIAPLFHNTTYLINNDGEMVHKWTHELDPAGATYLYPDGMLARGEQTINPAINFGGLGGTAQLFDWDGNVIWKFVYSDSAHALHHHTARLPNGNILMLAWEYHGAEDAIKQGRDPDKLPGGALWAEQIIEVRPTLPEGGEIVWEWHLWDHLVQDFDPTKANYGSVADHPELVDINYHNPDNADWIHANALDYNEELDQIMVSAPGFSELWIIDHSTTTEEAAGHMGGGSGRGGDLLYRWGNRQAYRAAPQDGQSYFQLEFNHDTQWIGPGLPGEGNIMVFENGHDRQASRVYEFTPPVDGTWTYMRDPDGAFGPPMQVWSYDQPGTFYSVIASGQQRMPNGNTLIAETDTGRIFEVNTDGDIVWQYVNPVADSGPLPSNALIPYFNENLGIQSNAIFRAYRYSADYPGLAGNELIPTGPIELEATAVKDATGLPGRFALAHNYPNPFNPTTTISYDLPKAADATLTVYDVLGRQIRELASGTQPAGTHKVTFDATGLPSGVYFYRLQAEDYIETKRMVVIR